MKKFLILKDYGLTEHITAISCEIADICKQKHYKFIVNDTETRYIVCNTVQAVYELVEVR